jgi:hypothetical protein
MNLIMLMIRKHNMAQNGAGTHNGKLGRNSCWKYFMQNKAQRNLPWTIRFNYWFFEKTTYNSHSNPVFQITVTELLWRKYEKWNQNKIFDIWFDEIISTYTRRMFLFLMIRPGFSIYICKWYSFNSIMLTKCNLIMKWKTQDATHDINVI